MRLCISMQGVWVRSRVGELRSHMPQGQKNKNTKKEAIHDKLNKDFKNSSHFLQNLFKKLAQRGVTSGKESTCQCRRRKRCGFDPWGGKIPWRRKWQPTPIFLPGKFHGQRSLGVHSLWGPRELDTALSD